MPDRLVLEVQGAGLSPTAVTRVVANADVRVKADSATIEHVDGKVKLESRLTNGNLKLSFTPHFDWGTDVSAANEKPPEDFLQQLRQLGLTEAQVSQVVKLIESETKPEIVEHEINAITKDAGWWIITGKERTKPPSEVSGFSLNSISLPDVPINVTPSIDIDNLSIKDIHLSQNTTIESDNISTKGMTVDDFSVETDAVDYATFEKVEVSSFAMKPLAVSDFAINNISTEWTIPRLGSSNIPLEVESKEGRANIRVPIVVWHPRWRVAISFRILWKKVRLWIEFGFNVDIEIVYLWVMKLLRVTLTIRNAFLNAITVSLQIPRLALSGISVGLVKVAKLLYRRRSGQRTATGTANGRDLAMRQCATPMRTEKRGRDKRKEKLGHS